MHANLHLLKRGPSLSKSTVIKYQPHHTVVVACHNYFSPSKNRAPSRSQLIRTGLGASIATLGLELAPEAASAMEGFPVAPQSQGQVAMRTLKDSELIVSFFPKFAYDARGGGGLSDGSVMDDGRVGVKFDIDSLNIPDVYYKTASFVGVPIVPGLRIAILPSSLEGWINRSTGEAQLQFNAQFDFTAGSLYKAAPLLINTTLTTESVHGKKHSRQRKGVRLDSNGYAKLVGVSNVPKTGDKFMDNFLRLPTDALALMSCQFMFT
ncbi:hypothetical protein WJX84_007442 [Apatococcus fuscideae]|uniref:Uncharacterized protein n=1 Tax=Apatococcus fuscideae TaxID=2026836 RepID=A0AAW1TNB6_9CHLO